LGSSILKARKFSKNTKSLEVYGFQGVIKGKTNQAKDNTNMKWNAFLACVALFTNQG
jgi:hypothetical protein